MEILNIKQALNIPCFDSSTCMQIPQSYSGKTQIKEKNASRGTTTGITERVDMHIAAYQCMITRGGTQRGKWKTLGALLIFGWMLERPCRTT